MIPLVRPLAVLLVVAMVVADAAPTPGMGAAAAEEPITPVLSARRVPALVQAVAAGPALADELDRIVASGPVDTCLDVRVRGRSLYRTGQELSLIPASNQKVITARLVLEVLGAEHRFRTEVAGDLDTDGTVRGDLYLVGGGDPVLRTSEYVSYLDDDAGQSTSLEELADAVVAAGVERVTGGVVGDESRYDTLRSVPAWPDDRYLQQHQLGPLSALAVNQGFVSFPDTYSDETLAQLEPAGDPARFAAESFTDLLRERGVSVTAAGRAGARPPEAAGITAVESPPLDELIVQLLNRSDNQISELLVKEVGLLAGDGGTTNAGLAVLENTYRDLGLPTEGVGTNDGSGLDYGDRLTCGVLTTVLERAGPDSTIGRGLAVAGRTGTLRERFLDDDLAGLIRAKTGSLDAVTSLAGFAEPTAAPELVFGYIANGMPVTDELLGLQEELGRALVGYGADVPLSELGPW